MGNVMNKLQLTSATLLTAIGMSASALAADIPPAVNMPPRAAAPAMACSWCGVYVGINAGASWSQSEVTLQPTGFWNQDPSAGVFASNGSPRFDQTNFTGGGQIGLNSQWGALVVGLEVDAAYLGFNVTRKATATSTIPGPLGSTPEIFNYNESIKNDWVSTQRLRIGWAVSPALLLYGTGGLALSKQEFTQTYTIPNFNGGALAAGFTVNANGGGQVSKWVSGWAVGGGAEWKIWHNWSLRAEFLYIDLGTVEFNAPTVGGTGGLSIAGFTAHHENHMWTNLARMAINYQF
jgi:outer membrane immunogenic protein